MPCWSPINREQQLLAVKKREDWVDYYHETKSGLNATPDRITHENESYMPGKKRGARSMVY